MKRLNYLLAGLVLLSGTLASAQYEVVIPKVESIPVPEIDFSKVAGTAHPRLFLDEKGFEELNAAIAGKKSDVFIKLHRKQISQANSLLKAEPLKYKKDVSGKRILTISRDALARIFACAYAYRTTGDVKYVDFVDACINQVCDFKDWNPSHYLDTGEMGLAVAIGYDWLYDVLPEATRKKAEEKLYEYQMLTTLNPKLSKWSNGVINWNPVCHGGSVAVALAIYDLHPEEAQKIIRRAIPSNTRSVIASYSPDGVYPEGAGYWSYGTSFQIVLNTLLTNTFGTDFGLSEIEGFSKTGDFIMYTQGNLGKKYDYSDTGSGGTTFREGWYFAYRFNDPSYLYLDNRAVQSGKFNCKDRLSPLDLIFASRYDGNEIPAPSKRVYSARSNNPIVIARTGWERNDLYLGYKAGRGSVNHGHLDVGSFIYEADGVRWASEMHFGGYSPIEKALKDIGAGGLFNNAQDSWRWKLISYNNYFHSTLTVNDKIHIAKAFVDMKAIDEPDRIGGVADLTPLFDGDVTSAVRTVVIKDESYLEITDEITAPADRAADIRWTLITETEPEVSKKAITLTKGDIQARITAKGAKVKYQTWSTDPADYANGVNEKLKPVKGIKICGYTYTIPAGKSVKVVTTLKTL